MSCDKNIHVCVSVGVAPGSAEGEAMVMVLHCNGCNRYWKPFQRSEFGLPSDLGLTEIER